jgi:hypothetical protein
VPRFKVICRANFNEAASARLREQGLYWFTGGRVEAGSGRRRRHHLEIEAEDREEALETVRRAIENAGGDAGDLDIV